MPRLPSTANLLAICIFCLVAIKPNEATFNFEVERRVFERVDDFMSGPRVATSLLERFRKNGAFPNNLNVKDKDAYQTLSYSLMNEYKFDMIYYGTEDGIFLGYNEGVWGTYREPVNSGYKIDDPEMQKYYKGCVDRERGEPENCTMTAGSEYILCVDDCELTLCPDEETQKCALEPNTACEKEQKWCPKYAIKNVTDEHEASTLGYVPRTYHCHTPTGVFSQQPGEVLEDDRELGNCLYGDGRTLVSRDITGEYVCCGENQTCNPFVGGYRSRDYDPRYRSWYKQTKDKQRANWVEPYPFFSNLDLGITYSLPFYEEEEKTRRQIFRGVFAIDYTFEDITRFLKDSYGTSTPSNQNKNSGTTATDETYVVIYEAQEPNYMVAASTGRSAASKVLVSDPTKACPDDAKDDGSCDVVRVKMSDLAGLSYDEILRASYKEQVRRDYPRDLVEARLPDDAYVSQSSFYSSGEDLEWIILVITPIERSETDALTPEDGLFGVVCVIAGLGFVLCLAMFFSFYFKRKSKAVILADWRFTSAFILGCALMNVSTFTFLGENTEALCLSRMWTFHFLFALALSPLFVKVYRMYRLVGTPNRNPAIISNPKAVAMTLPIVVIQVIILTIFTIVDPPTPETLIEVDGTVVTQSTECTTNSNAFTFTVLGFECGLVFIGCVLAFMTRNMDSGFGQAKELMFSMYNIAFIGIVIAVIFFAMGIDASGRIVLISMGIFWGTVFSSAVFVVPRLIQTKEGQGVLPPRRASNKPRSSPRPSREQVQPKKNEKREKHAPSVKFSEQVHDIDSDRDRPITGWSAVEDEFEDAATGLKRASSVSIPEDEIWTQLPGDGSFLNGLGSHRDNTEKTETERDETWRSSDITDPSAVSSKQTNAKNNPKEPDGGYTVVSL